MHLFKCSFDFFIAQRLMIIIEEVIIFKMIKLGYPFLINDQHER